MGNIAKEDEFRLFLKSPKSGIKSINARSNCISRLRYVANVHRPITPSLTRNDIDSIENWLNITKEERGKHNSKKGISSLKAALNKYLLFLSFNYSTDLEKDLIDVRKSPDLNDTEKETLIQARLGQGKFRESLINLWKGCSVSGYKNTSLLIASHIKPWAKATNDERLDKYNGLLLTPNLDKAFDRGFITFDEGGKIIISKSLSEAKALGIHPKLKIQSFHKETKVYMLYHRNKIFKDTLE